MLETIINTAPFPEPKNLITVCVGNRVKHWSGSTGVVVDIRREYLYTTEYPGADAGEAVYGIKIIVLADKIKRQRKPSIPAQWDGIVEILG